MQSKSFLPSLAAVALAAALSWSGAALAGERPVVVELYTSQGCSSCPPADAVLAELADREGVIALSLHVDYWDYIGWKDPFALPEITARQRAYSEKLKSRYVYTPQMIIDGRSDVVGSRRTDVRAKIEAAQEAAGEEAVVIRFEPGSGGGTLGKVVVPAGKAPAEGATLWLAVYDESRETEIRSGENSGKTVRYHHVVRLIEPIGRWTGEAMTVPLDPAPYAEAGHGGCALILQAGKVGPVLGALQMEFGGS